MNIQKEIIGGSYTFQIDENWNEAEAAKLPARTLAYIGDSVYDLGLRLHHVKMRMDEAGHLHDSIVCLVNSSYQAKIFNIIFEKLNEEEKELVKTWRNAKIPGRYGSGTRGEYARATAFEAWIGYLFVTKQNDRLKDIFELALAEAKKD